MRLLTNVRAILPLLLLGLCLSCSGSAEKSSTAAEETTAAESIESAVDAGEEAAGEAVEEAEMALDDLEAALAEKVADLEDVEDELKGLSPEDLMGDKGKQLKAKSETLNEEIRKLKEKIDGLTK